MRNILDEIKQRAKALQKTIVLCEGEDGRVVQAAADATKEGVARIVLLGNEAEIKAADHASRLKGCEEMVFYKIAAFHIADIGKILKNGVIKTAICKIEHFCVYVGYVGYVFI